MNIYYTSGYPISDYLYHHGIKGQRWGIRRFQNNDGSLTTAGRKRYGSSRSIQRELNKIDKELAFNVGDATKNVVMAYKKSRGTSLKDGSSHIGDKYLQKDKEFSSKAESLTRRRDALIKQAIESGYDVRTKELPRRTVRAGEIALKALIITGTAGIINPTLTTGIIGTKYYVKKEKK